MKHTTKQPNNESTKSNQEPNNQPTKQEHHRRNGQSTKIDKPTKQSNKPTNT